MTSPCAARHGFSLIELLVVVAVLAIVLVVAYPVYTDFVERSRRSEATDALQNLATLQEQFYYHNKAYSNDLAELGMPVNTPNDYYQLSIVAGAPVAGTIQSYSLRATAQGRQAADTACATIQLDSNGTRTPATCW